MLLEGILVLDLSEHIAGPFAALRLADLGARVIKVVQSSSRKEKSDLHAAMNRNKEIYTLDLHDAHGYKKLRHLIAKADVLIISYPEKLSKELGLDYASVESINPRIVYGCVSGYGNDHPWAEKDDDEIFVQAQMGLPWLNGDQEDPPIPFPLSVVEMFTSANLVQGILAACIQRSKTGKGMVVEVSKMESALDFQFEVLTTHLNDGGKLPQRSKVNSAHAYLAAPYGVYETQSGYLALAMGSVLQLSELLQCEALAQYDDPASWFTQRDEIKQYLADHLRTKPASHWIQLLEQGGYWCAEVQTVEELLDHEVFHGLQMVQHIQTQDGTSLTVTRCPIRVDGQLVFDGKSTSLYGDQTHAIDKEFGCDAL